MAATRYILVRSADDNPAGGTQPSFADPFCPTSFVGTGHIVVPVENEQAMHVCEMHHVMAQFALELVIFFEDRQGNNNRKLLALG